MPVININIEQGLKVGFKYLPGGLVECIFILADESDALTQITNQSMGHTEEKEALFQNALPEVSQYKRINVIEIANGYKYKKKDTCEIYNEALSKRETDVIRLVSAGLSNKKIAEKLYISTCTVKKHINSIYSKLKAKNRVQAVEKFKLLLIDTRNDS
ncbi:MAG: response regulator transcription factor [Bacillota bacterium]